MNKSTISLCVCVCVDQRDQDVCSLFQDERQEKEKKKYEPPVMTGAVARGEEEAGSSWTSKA